MWFWLLLWAAGMTLIAGLDAPQIQFWVYLGGMSAAGLGWLGLLGVAQRRPFSNWEVTIPVALGLAFRLYALFQAPAFSTDLDRYVYEGRVALWGGLDFPFRVAPADAGAHGVPVAFLDASWSRINHPDLTTIYPPLCQLVFVAAAALGGGPGILKLFLIAAELGIFVLIARFFRARGQVGLAVAYWLLPIGIIETAREGHADVLSVVGLTLLVLGFGAGRARLGYVGVVLAALGKLNGLVALPAALRSDRRGAGTLLLLLFLGLPFFLAGPDALVGLFAYGARWQAGDGAFSLVLVVSEAILGGDYRRIGPFTVTQHQLARAITLVLWLSFSALVLRRRAATEAIGAQAGALVLGLLLLTPTFHPWYSLWLAPFIVAAPGFIGRRAACAAVLLAPLLHYPGHLEAIGGAWTDPVWSRSLVHGAIWLAFGVDLFLHRGFRYPRPGQGPACRSNLAFSLG